MGSIAKENRRNLNGFLGRADDIAGNVVSVADEVDSSLLLPALGTIIEMVEFQFLRSKYQKE